MTSGWLSILLSVGLVLLFMHYLIESARRYHAHPRESTAERLLTSILLFVTSLLTLVSAVGYLFIQSGGDATPFAIAANIGRGALLVGAVVLFLARRD